MDHTRHSSLNRVSCESVFIEDFRRRCMSKSDFLQQPSKAGTCDDAQRGRDLSLTAHDTGRSPSHTSTTGSKWSHCSADSDHSSDDGSNNSLCGPWFMDAAVAYVVPACQPPHMETCEGHHAAPGTVTSAMTSAFTMQAHLNGRRQAYANHRSHTHALDALATDASDVAACCSRQRARVSFPSSFFTNPTMSRSPHPTATSSSRRLAAAAASAAGHDFRRAESDQVLLTCPTWGSSNFNRESGSDEDREDEERSAREVREAIVRSAQLRRHGSWSVCGRSCPASPQQDDEDDDEGLRKHCSASLSGPMCGESTAPAVASRSRSNYHLTDRHAAVELFLRLNHARQTLDYVKRQAASFAALDKMTLNVWDALSLLGELCDPEASLMRPDDVPPVMTPMDHAFQTAELCRLQHPELEWLPLVGLIHGLGKLLAHRRWGGLPQWAISGESFPVGCRFSPLIAGAEFFSANPDRRRRQLNTPCGMYAEHCGLTNVYMSWSAAEYLYLVLALNETSLPPEALFIIRHQKFLTLQSSGTGGYRHLLSADDWRMLPLLTDFERLSRYQDVGPLPDGALQGAERKAYYSALIDKYLGAGKLCW